MMRSLVAVLPALFSLGLAETSTSCNPTNTTCSPDTGLDQWSFQTDFTQGSSSNWTAIAGNVTYGSDGAEFIIKKRYDAPTLQTNFYLFFGEVEVTMKAANGTGIVSSVVMLSDDLDEIDWETTGTDTTQIESNYFGKGNTTTYDRAIWETVATPQDEFHAYKVVWTPSTMTWYIDGVATRTLAYADAVDGSNFPQTPMVVKLGIWAGGDPSNSEGTIEWAGGETDYSDVPFTMLVKSVSITNYNPAQWYNYTDTTGAYTSIDASNSTTSSGSSSSYLSVSAAATSSARLIPTASAYRASKTSVSSLFNSTSSTSISAASSSAASSSASASTSVKPSASASLVSGATSMLPVTSSSLMIGLGFIWVFVAL